MDNTQQTIENGLDFLNPILMWIPAPNLYQVVASQIEKLTTLHENYIKDTHEILQNFSTLMNTFKKENNEDKNTFTRHLWKINNVKNQKRPKKLSGFNASNVSKIKKDRKKERKPPTWSDIAPPGYGLLENDKLEKEMMRLRKRKNE